LQKHLADSDSEVSNPRHLFSWPRVPAPNISVCCDCSGHNSACSACQRPWPQPTHSSLSPPSLHDRNIGAEYKVDSHQERNVRPGLWRSRSVLIRPVSIPSGDTTAQGQRGQSRVSTTHSPTGTPRSPVPQGGLRGCQHSQQNVFGPLQSVVEFPP